MKQDNTFNSAKFAHLFQEMMTGVKHVDWTHEDPDIGYAGKRIVLPEEPGKMSLREAAEVLHRKADDEEVEMDVTEVIDAYPLDGGVAFVKAMKELYGWASPKPTMTFFGPQPPKLLTVQIAPYEEDPYETQVPWGEFTVPGIENSIFVGKLDTNEGPKFVARGSVKKREQHILRELAAKTREILKEGSIYKAKAIRLRSKENGGLDYDANPSFISTRYIRTDELILNPIEFDQIEASLWTPIRNTETCCRHSIPLKRGILLEGTYGCGKTMTANVTAKICVENGWTFILLDDVRSLKDALLFAKRYAPAVVFAEDVDRVATVRDQRGNDLLNTIDGILGKNSEVFTVLTTNHVEKLDRAMLRPGRLDAVVSVRPPEKEAVQRLIRLYARGLLSGAENLDPVGEELAGQIPATIREVVERSKLAMISRGSSDLLAKDLLAAAVGMKSHLALLNAPVAPKTDAQKLAESLRAVIATDTTVSAQSAAMSKMDEVMDLLKNNIIVALASMQSNDRNAVLAGQKFEKALKNVETKVDGVRAAVSAKAA